MSAHVQPKDVDKMLIALRIIAKNQEQPHAHLNDMHEYLFTPWNAAQP